MPEYLEEVPGLPEAFFVHIPFRRSRYGAVHDITVTGAYSHLRIAFVTELQKTSAEIHHRFGVTDITVFSVPCLITIPNGVFRLVTGRVIGETTVFAAHELKPTLGFIVPSNVGFGLQSLVHNRVTYILEHSAHRTQPRLMAAYDHEQVAPLWDQNLPGEPFSYNDPGPAPE
jgi:hypothetical protein